MSHSALPAQKSVITGRAVRTAFTIVAYVAVFWVLLPVLLFTTGFRLDVLLPVSLAENTIMRAVGCCLALSGFLLMILAMAQLWSRGKGLPISHLPPTKFVTGGCYRYLRHPIYVGYNAVFAGAALLMNSFWSLAFSGPLLLIGWTAYALFYEEPLLIDRFGSRYRDYRSATPIWLPKALSRPVARVTQSVVAGLLRLLGRRNVRDGGRQAADEKKQDAGEDSPTHTSRFEPPRDAAASNERGFYIKLGLLLYLLWIIAFEAIGRYTATLPTHDLTGSLDRMIPLIPAFIWPYLFCYVFPFLVAFIARDWHRVNRGLLSLLFANLTAFVVYAAFPVAFPKPELGRSISERALELEYVIDFHPGANNLPSLHVIFPWLVYFICRKQGLTRVADFSLFLAASLITLSTVFVKQHIVADVVAGILWAVASWIVAGFFYPRWLEAGSGAVVAFRRMVHKSALFVVIAIFLTAFFAFRR
ncbi:MAG: phosphatase PAP2 family protein [Acidobacteriia bacterium]|nr:phosphatase PAP2 family protein [Terriglobia bacterium]